MRAYTDGGRHRKIESKLRPKKKLIYCPAEYFDIIKTAWLHSQPYKVKYVDRSFFRDCTSVGYLKSILPESRAGDSTVTDLRATKYNPDGAILYKLPTCW